MLSILALIFIMIGLFKLTGLFFRAVGTLLGWIFGGHRLADPCRTCGDGFRPGVDCSSGGSGDRSRCTDSSGGVLIQGG